MTDNENVLPNQPVALRVIAMPADTNSSGDIFGGWIMSQVDIAGSILAHQKADGRVATVAVQSFLFLKPVFVGDVVSCYTRVNKIGHTSITIDVTVYAERDHSRKASEKVAEAMLTYVAIDEHRQPRPILINRPAD